MATVMRSLVPSKLVLSCQTRSKRHSRLFTLVPTKHVHTRPTRLAASRGAAVVCMAAGGGHHPVHGPYEEHEYPSKEFIAYCEEAFPGDEGVATLEEARTLISDEIGWKLLDVRSASEIDQGKVTGAVNIPLINVKKRGLEMNQHININFMAEVQKKFPHNNQGVVVMCSDGLNRSIQSVFLMDEAGYKNIVRVRYGFNGWINKYTPKLERRRGDDWNENYKATGDSQGLHIVRKAYNVDALDKIPIKDHTEWLEYSEVMESGKV